MRALDRKLLRDLRLMWSQALTIALVVASGIAGFVTSLSAVDSLALARDRFYDEAVFADVFASARRAPDSLAAHLRETLPDSLVALALVRDDDPAACRLAGLIGPDGTEHQILSSSPRMQPRTPPRL